MNIDRVEMWYVVCMHIWVFFMVTFFEWQKAIKTVCLSNLIADEARMYKYVFRVYVCVCVCGSFAI